MSDTAAPQTVPQPDIEPEPVVAAAAPAVDDTEPEVEAAPSGAPMADTAGRPYRRWQALAVLEGVWTGDDRYIEPGALTWRDFPLSLMAQSETAPGHDGAQLAGRIDAGERVDAADIVDSRTGQPYGDGAVAVMLSGVFDSDQMATATADRIAGGFLKGVSVDLSDVEMVDELTDADGNPVSIDDIDSGRVDPMDIRMRSRVTAGRIMGLCYDDQTEILTELRGWQPFAELTLDDRVATHNQKTGEFEWALPTYYHHDRWTGRMIRFTGRNLDLLVTPNHRMWVAPVAGGPAEIVTAEDLLARGATAYRVPLTSEWTAPDVATVRIQREPQPEGSCACGCGEPVGSRGEAAPRCSVDECDRPAVGRGWCSPHYHRWRSHGDPTAGGPFRKVRSNVKTTRQRTTLPGHGHGLSTEPLVFAGDDFAAFMGAYLAEGSCGGSKSVSISQMPASKGYAMYEELLSRMFPSHFHDGKAFRATSARLRDYLRQFGLAENKFIPDSIKNMSARQLQIFLDHYLAGDGTKEVRGSHTRWRAVTVSRRLADDIQEIAQKIGISASVRVRVPAADAMIGNRVIRKENMLPIYSVSMRTSELAPIWKAEAVDDYDGDVRCVSVPNEILYVRRNGYPVWCGNTATPFPAFEGAFIQLLDDDGNTGPAMAPGQPTVEQQAAAIHASSAPSPRRCLPCESGAIVASAAPVEPPAAWFENPGQDRYDKRIVVTDEGRVYGYVAPWGVCHTGISGQCVVAPHSAIDYALFTVGSVKTSEGDVIPTGAITLGTGHEMDLGAGVAAAAEHYDNTGTAVADVAVGEDEYGIWFSGALRPDATPERIRALRGSQLSGDWRPWGGNRELIAALVVNRGGFPVVRQLVASGQPGALVASFGALMPASPELDEVRALLPTLTAAARRELAAQEAESAGRRARAESLRSRRLSLRRTALKARLATITKETS